MTKFRKGMKAFHLGHTKLICRFSSKIYEKLGWVEHFYFYFFIFQQALTSNPVLEDELTRP